MASIVYPTFIAGYCLICRAVVTGRVKGQPGNVILRTLWEATVRWDRNWCIFLDFLTFNCGRIPIKRTVSICPITFCTPMVTPSSQKDLDKQMPCRAENGKTKQQIYSPLVGTKVSKMANNFVVLHFFHEKSAKFQEQENNNNVFISLCMFDFLWYLMLYLYIFR